MLLIIGRVTKAGEGGDYHGLSEQGAHCRYKHTRELEVDIRSPILLIFLRLMGCGGPRHPNMARPNSKYAVLTGLLRRRRQAQPRYCRCDAK